MTESARKILLSARINSFLVFSEVASVKETAKILGLCDSAVSRHLADLEKELGITLIDRRVHPFKLTADGRHFADCINKQYLGMFKTLNELQQVNNKPLSLNIGTLQTLSTTATIELLNKIKGDIGYTLCLSGSSDYLLKLLKKQELDLIIVSRLLSDLKEMRVATVFTEPMMLVLPPDMAKQSTKWDWDKLRFCGLPYVSFYKDSAGKIQYDKLKSIGVTFPNRIEVDNTGLVLSLVGRNRGWGLLRGSAMLPFRNLLDKVTLAPIQGKSIYRTTYIVARDTIPNSSFMLIYKTLLDIFSGLITPEIVSLAPFVKDQLFCGEVLAENSV